MFQVVLESLDAPEGEEATEIVHAKYMLGSDGSYIKSFSPEILFN